MDYEALTPGQQLAIVLGRLARYEQQRYGVALDLDIATAAEDPTTAIEKNLARLDAAITVTRAARDELVKAGVEPERGRPERPGRPQRG